MAQLDVGQRALRRSCVCAPRKVRMPRLPALWERSSKPVHQFFKKDIKIPRITRRNCLVVSVGVACRSVTNLYDARVRHMRSHAGAQGLYVGAPPRI